MRFAWNLFVVLFGTWLAFVLFNWASAIVAGATIFVLFLRAEGFTKGTDDE